MTERRTTAKLIRFRPKELARITKRARACGRTSACFIREAALGLIQRPGRDTAADPLLGELAHIGRSLDQLARLARAGLDTALAERVSAALDGHRALVRQVVQDRGQGGRAPAR